MIESIVKKYNYEIIHDNLKGQWLIADLKDKKYQFYFNFNYKKENQDNNIDNADNEKLDPKKSFL